MHNRKLLLLLSACALLGACSETREVMGLNNQAPDEFAVVDRPPLSMPPDYALRPPRPGQPAFQDVQPSKMAAEALYGPGKMELVQQKGVTSLNGQSLSPSEQALITNSGSASADPKIRSRLDREATQQVVTSRRLMDTILFWREPRQPPGAMVDATAERKRIEAAQRANQPVNAGATPVTGDKTVTAVQ